MEEARNISMYAVKDELVGRFMAPIYFQGDEEAKRWFYTQVEEIALRRSNPADYGLYTLGTFNEGTGYIVPNVEKIATGTGARKEK